MGGVVRPSPLYIEGWAPALAPPPSPRPAAKEGGVGGKFPPSLLEAPLGFCPRLAGWALWGLVPLAQCGQDTPS